MIEPLYICSECLATWLWEELVGIKNGDESLEELECPECGGPMTPGEKRDNGRCQYCEDAGEAKHDGPHPRKKQGAGKGQGLRPKR